MQILVSYENPQNYCSVDGADRTRTYDLNLEPVFLALFMCLNKFVRTNYSQRPLIPALRTRQWFPDWKVHLFMTVIDLLTVENDVFSMVESESY